MTDAPDTAPLPPRTRGSSEGAGQSIDAGKGRIFPCGSCGADLEFHAGVQELKCPFCGHVEPIEDDGREIVERDLRAALREQAERRKQAQEDGDKPKVHELTCGACAGTVVFTDTLSSTHCPYCGSPVQREGVHDATDRIPVDGVLPFRVENQAARTKLKAWLAGRWFLPAALKQTGINERFTGLYVPYWTFDAMTHTRYRGERGDHYYVSVKRGEHTVQERRTRWSSARGSFSQFFDDVLVVAGRKLPRGLLRSLEPWPLEDVEPFDQRFVAGKLAETYDVELDEGFGIAEDRIEDALRSEVRRRIGGDEQRIHSIETRWPALSFKHLLLPIWILSYRFKQKTYQVTVNAATGEVQGERPYDWVKITLLVLGILVVGVGGYFAFQALAG